MKKQKLLLFYLLGLFSFTVLFAQVFPGQVLAKAAAKTPVKKFTTPREILRYLDAEAGHLTAPSVDDNLIRLTELQRISQETYEKQLFSDTLNPRINQYKMQDLLSQKNIKEQKIKDLVANILADGFKLSSSEGMYYIEPDYPRLSKNYGRYTTSQMSDFLKIMSREVTQHFSEDAALKVSLSELSGRIAAIETFTRQHQDPDFSKLYDLRQIQQRYVVAYLIGLNNTPAFNYQTDSLKSQFLKSYKDSVKKYKNTEFAALLTDYLRLLAKNNYKKTSAILDFANTAPSRLAVGEAMNSGAETPPPPALISTPFCSLLSPVYSALQSVGEIPAGSVTARQVAMSTRAYTVVVSPLPDPKSLGNYDSYIGVLSLITQEFDKPPAKVTMRLISSSFNNQLTTWAGTLVTTEHPVVGDYAEIRPFNHLTGKQGPALMRGNFIPAR